MSVSITESLCCTSETNTTLQINYTSIKWKWKDRDSQNASGIRSSIWFVYCLLPPRAGKIHVGRNWVSCTLKALVAQLCPTLCNPMDYSPLCSSVHGILQQEYWSGLPFPAPGDLPDPGIESGEVSCITGPLYHLSHQGSLYLELGLIQNKPFINFIDLIDKC